MRSHGHSHGGINEEADCLTNLGAIGEAIEGAANFFFGATVYETLYELVNGYENEDKLGWPLYISIGLGVISMGAAYTHRLLDIYHQQVRNDTSQHESHADCEHECGYISHEENSDTSTAASKGNSQVEQKKSTPNRHQHESDFELTTFDNALTKPLKPVSIDIHEGENKQSLPSPKLTGIQRFSLFGDATSHIFARAGLLTSLVDGIATTFAKVTLPPATRGLILLGSTFFGAATSASGIRTCRNAMLEQNLEKEINKQVACKHGLRT